MAGEQSTPAPPTLDQRDPVALVTGGGRGIGVAVSRMLARCGARVAVNHHAHRDRAVQVAEEITGEGGKALAVAAVVAFLASDLAALVTGGIVDVNGGAWMG